MSTRAQAIAEEAAAKIFAADAAVHLLGIALDSVSPGSARVVMKVRADMINGAGICHGGLITTLADAAFAFACNSYNKLTLAAGISVEFITPAKDGDVLTATATEVSRRGRSGVYDVTVTNQKDETVAIMRGRCQEARGRRIVD